MVRLFPNRANRFLSVRHWGAVLMVKWFLDGRKPYELNSLGADRSELNPMSDEHKFTESDKHLAFEWLREYERTDEEVKHCLCVMQELVSLNAEVERLRGEKDHFERLWLAANTELEAAKNGAGQTKWALQEFTEAYREDCERQGMIPDNNYRNMRLAAAYRAALAAIEAKE